LTQNGESQSKMTLARFTMWDHTRPECRIQTQGVPKINSTWPQQQYLKIWRRPDREICKKQQKGAEPVIKFGPTATP